MSTLVSDFLSELEDEELNSLTIPKEQDSSSTLINSILNTTLLKTPDFLTLITSLSTGTPNLLKSNEYIITLDENINDVYEYVRNIYKKRFPGLDEIIKNNVKYVLVMERIMGFEGSIKEIDFNDLIQSNIALVIKMTFSNCGGEELNEKEVLLIRQALEAMKQLIKYKEMLLEFVSSKMNNIAPNLSYIVGEKIAAQLIGIAGGIEQLANLPSSTVMLLGRDKKNLLGLSAGSYHSKFYGFIYNCDIVKNTPLAFKKRAARIVANKSVLAIRADVSNNYRNDNSVGVKMKQKILKQLNKIQEPPPAVQEKPLPVPDSYKVKRHRGGKKARRLKRIYGMTDIRRKKNQMAFGTAQVEDHLTGEGFGLLGAPNSSRLIQPKTQKKVKKRLKTFGEVRISKTPFYGGEQSGLSSSLAFTPVQGIALQNPAALNKKKKKSRYFDSFEFRRPKKRRKLE